MSFVKETASNVQQKKVVVLDEDDEKLKLLQVNDILVLS